MTSNELIELLRKEDPDGNTPVCVDNAAIIGVQTLPAYYDGALNVIECEDGRPVRGYRTRQGKKIDLERYYVSDCIENDDCFGVLYPTEQDRERYELSDQRTRLEIAKITNDVHCKFFVSWVWDKIQKIRPIPAGWIDRIKKAAADFYDQNDMTPSWKDMPERIKMRRTENGGWPSANSRDQEWWEEQFFVNWDEYSRIVIRRKDA